MRITNKLVAILAASLISAIYITPAFAAKAKGKPLLDKGKLSIGVGVSNNSVSGPVDDEPGYQFFAAYDLVTVNLIDGVESSVEFGVMDYGYERDSTGIWGTYVIDGKFTGQFGWLGRIGLDIGDDSGFMLGAGVGYDFGPKVATRLEYVIRDEVKSLQLNFLYRL